MAEAVEVIRRRGCRVRATYSLALRLRQPFRDPWTAALVPNLLTVATRCLPRSPAVLPPSLLKTYARCRPGVYAA